MFMEGECVWISEEGVVKGVFVVVMFGVFSLWAKKWVSPSANEKSFSVFDPSPL